MKNQTLSIEQMKHLKSLGVETSKASMYWGLPTLPDYKRKLNIVGINGNLKAAEERDIVIGAFTLQDMLEMMPTSICDNSYFLIAAFDELHGTNTRVYTIRYVSVSHKDYCYFEGTSLINATYQMLCWLAQNEYLKGGKP